jgi:hypothetical protein
MIVKKVFLTSLVLLHITILICGVVSALNVDEKNISQDYSFSFTLPPSKEVTRGETGFISVLIENIGNSTKNISINVLSECCALTFPGNIVLQPGKKENVIIEAHAPLWKNAGQYILEMKVRSGSTEKTKMMVVEVKESELIERLQGMKKFSQNLRRTIEQYGKSGVNVANLLAEMDRIGMEIEKANEAIKEDNKDNLFNSLLFLEFSLYYKIPAEVGSLSNIIFLYRILWLSLFTVSCILIILISKMRAYKKSRQNP